MNRLLATTLLCLMLASCAARLPSHSSAERSIERYFKRYAKRYPTTAFGQYKVTKVEIIDKHEIRKHHAAVEAYVTLGNGDIRKISTTLEKKPLGWKFISWENPEGS